LRLKDNGYLPAGIDLNCDLGEGAGHDADIIPFITSANISCGYHAGTMSEIEHTLMLCAASGVRIGAHPGFPDRANFGRKAMYLTAEQIYKLIAVQLEITDTLCQKYGALMTHMKLHGALYNQTAGDAEMAEPVIRAILDFDPGLEVYGLSGSLYLHMASESGLRVRHEVFADRTYMDDGTLTPRDHPRAFILTEEQMIRHVLDMTNAQSVTTVSGFRIHVRAETICLHGDGPSAISFARKLHSLMRIESKKNEP